MPFKSKAQARYLFATNPAVAREFAAHTPNYKALPERKHAVKGKMKGKMKGNTHMMDGTPMKGNAHGKAVSAVAKSKAGGKAVSAVAKKRKS